MNKISKQITFDLYCFPSLISISLLSITSGLLSYLRLVAKNYKA